MIQTNHTYPSLFLRLAHDPPIVVLDYVLGSLDYRVEVVFVGVHLAKSGLRLESRILEHVQ